jgi:phage shock protein PspC (stress-responsive transcriptional regulator)
MPKTQKKETVEQPKVTHTPRLVRLESDRMVGGVASGIAQYLAVDPILIRMFFLILLFGAGSGFMIYLILWIILPSESSVKSTSKDVVDENIADVKNQAQKIVSNVDTEHDTGRIIIGALIIFFGIMAMLRMFGVNIDFSWMWPWAIIAIGIVIIVKK